MEHMHQYMKKSIFRKYFSSHVATMADIILLIVFESNHNHLDLDDDLEKKSSVLFEKGGKAHQEEGFLHLM